MLEMICTIPENVGWVIVGATGMLCVMMMIKFANLFVQMCKEWHENTEETAYEE